MARDGKSNPFDGSGGTGSGSNFSRDEASTSRGPGPAGSRPTTMVPPGGLLPPTAPKPRPGMTIGAGSPGKPLPIKLGG